MSSGFEAPSMTFDKGARERLIFFVCFQNSFMFKSISEAASLSLRIIASSLWHFRKASLNLALDDFIQW
jgi:hypothetical protein